MCGIAIFLTSGLIPVVAQTNTNSNLNFDSFRIVSERNIFDPSRSGQARQRGRTPVKQVKIDTFSLLGTISYEKGQFAFFDGSSSKFHKTLKTGDTIAGYKITAIDYNQVKLQSTNKSFDFPVGMQMKREDEGEWHLSGRAAEQPLPTTSTSSDSGSSESSSSSSSDSSSSGSESDILKRLMQKRAQELNEK